MSVDLSTLKAGDTVVFRNGGKSVVGHIEISNISSYPYGVMGDTMMCWNQEGRLVSVATKHPFDIIEIIPAPEKKTALDKFVDKCTNSGPAGSPWYVNQLIELAQAIQQTLQEMKDK